MGNSRDEWEKKHAGYKAWRRKLVAAGYDFWHRGVWYCIILGWLKPRGRVLDLGCGDGKLKKYAGFVGLKDYVQVDVEGLVADVLSFAEALSFKDESFDWVLCFSALDNLADVHLALMEVRRVLRQGGRLGIVVIAWPFPKTPSGCHTYAFTEGYLAGLFLSTGFVVAHAMRVHGTIWAIELVRRCV